MSQYGYVKKKVLWYRNNSSSDIVDISRYVTGISTTKTFEPVNNRCDINMIDNDLLYTNDQFTPQENDKIFVYAKIITDAGDTELDSLDIIWNGRFVDHKRDESSSSKRITLNIVDWGYDVFNKIHKESYNDAGLRTNEIVERIIKTAAELDDGSFSIDTSLVASQRNDSSPFPVLEFSQVNKANHDLLSELGQTNWTNSETEISTDNRVITLPMILDFRGNYAVWQEQNLSTVLTVDNNSFIDSISLVTENEGSTNRLILDCGDDLEGNNITIIIRDSSSTGSTSKETQKTRQNLAGKDDDYDNTYHYLRAQSSLEGWSNATFRDKVKELAESYSNVWFDTFGRGRPKLKVVLPKIDIELGELVDLQRKKFLSGLYRVTRVTQDLEEQSWSTTITMEKFEV